MSQAWHWWLEQPVLARVLVNLLLFPALGWFAGKGLWRLRVRRWRRVDLADRPQGIRLVGLHGVQLEPVLLVPVYLGRLNEQVPGRRRRVWRAYWNLYVPDRFAVLLGKDWAALDVQYLPPRAVVRVMVRDDVMKMIKDERG